VLLVGWHVPPDGVHPVSLPVPASPSEPASPAASPADEPSPVLEPSPVDESSLLDESSPFDASLPAPASLARLPPISSASEGARSEQLVVATTRAAASVIAIGAAGIRMASSPL
jgi:hypothetical protein